jgi:hypothetical protein
MLSATPATLHFACQRPNYAVILKYQHPKMPTLRSVLFLAVTLTIIFLALVENARAVPIANPEPDPNLGLQFSLHPDKTEKSVVQPQHNESSLEERQSTGLAVWVTHWFPPPQCSDGVCTITSVDDLPHIKVNGEGYTVGGRVFVGIYRWPANTLSWGMNINVIHYNGWRDASFGLQTPVIDCSGFDLTHPANSYAAAYDWSTARWSPVWWLYTGCAVL